MTETTPDDFSWMEAAPPPVRPARKKPKSGTRKPNKGKAKREERKTLKVAQRQTLEPKVESVSKIDHAGIRGKVMFQAVSGKKRIWACDGQYVFFRRPRDANGQPARDANGDLHRAILRHENFIARGDYKYIETQDDVEICQVSEQSSFYRKPVYLGQLSEGGLNRMVAITAVKRDWPLYTDLLEELASRVKSKWRTEGQAKLCWEEHLKYIENLIALRGGPTPTECGAALARVRQARGEGSGRVILLGS
ncbi:MAG: hypothetical protein LLG14_27570 [Nocardiaceae bacterium]|nr:hypothetical protein [Nocardiaceae bacterium]